MNVILYYGGFALAATLFLLSIFLFFYLRVPAAIVYFTQYRRTSILSSAPLAQKTGNLKKTARPTAPRLAVDTSAPTEFIDIQEGGTTVMDAASYGISGEQDTYGMPTSLLEGALHQGGDGTAVLDVVSRETGDGRVVQGITEVLDRTEILPEL